MNIIIPGELTDLNTYIQAERTNKFIGSAVKKEETERVHTECIVSRPQKETGSRFFLFIWYSSSKRKDPDNIAFAKKFIMDGLVKAGVIPDDTQKYVIGFMDLFFIDKENPRVEVRTMEDPQKALEYLSNS